MTTGLLTAAMVLSLFETGYLHRATGLFEASPGHLSETGMATAIADAMRRGALSEGGIDFMGLDWFELAELPVQSVRDQFCLPAKSHDAVSAGSVGPLAARGHQHLPGQCGQ